MSEISVPPPPGLHSLPREVLDHIAVLLDRRALLACVRIRALHVSAASLLWERVVVPSVSGRAKGLWKALRRTAGGDGAAGGTEYAPLVRRLEVLVAMSRPRVVEVAGVLRNCAGGRLASLGMSLGKDGAAALWAKALGAAPQVLCQIVRISLFDVSCAGGVGNLVRLFEHLRDFSMAVCAQHVAEEITAMLGGMELGLRSFAAAFSPADGSRFRAMSMGMSALAGLGPRLRELKLERTAIRTDGVPEPRSFLPRLESASFVSCRNDSPQASWAQILAALPKLKRLELEVLATQGLRQMRVLESQTGLEHLRLVADLDDALMVDLAGMASLRSLELRGIDLMRAGPSTFHLDLLRRCSGILHEMRLQFVKLEARQRAAFPSLTFLEVYPVEDDWDPWMVAFFSGCDPLTFPAVRELRMGFEGWPFGTRRRSSERLWPSCRRSPRCLCGPRPWRSG
ncbi:hypothetical protein DFJ74DRAFT_664019 [Hyaloraphidium curvatum]|nr:hypothetical protein DFJ74DRAFT_664019 [Hyaloraphidium curvatum]